MVNEARSFMVVNNKKGAYGIGDTMAEAVKNCKREAGGGGRLSTQKEELTVIAFTCKKDQLEIVPRVDLEYMFPTDEVAMRFTAIV